MLFTGDSAEMKYLPKLTACLVFLLLLGNLLTSAQTQASRPPKLIRDTDVAEGKENTETATPKTPNPKLAEQNVKIGNYYLKMKNYAAASQRFLEAIEYQQDSMPAYQGLIRSYEKNGDIAKAIAACKTFLDKNPDSPKAIEFRDVLAKLEKSSK
jgi:tetratricopeptide (TPR) repeat protein